MNFKINNFSLKNIINSKWIFSLTVFILLMIIIDSSIVKTFGYVNSRFPGNFDLLLFSSLTFFFIITNYILINSSKNLINISTLKISNNLPKIVFISQYIIGAILVTIIIQMIFISQFDRNLLLLIVYISFISSIGFSMILLMKFLRWFKFNKNYYLLFYMMAFFLIVLKSTVAIMYISQELNNHSEIVKPQQTRSMIMNLSNANAIISNVLKNLYLYFSIFSYISIWITTSLMLRKYSKKYGKTKYWILISIPLTLFLIQDNIFKLEFFREFLLDYPNFFGILYTFFYSFIQLITAFLFGLGFLNTAKIINERNVSNSLLISTIGIMILIGSQETFGVFVGAYPPFGSVTISFMGLGSYLLLIGIIGSSLYITKSSKIRDEIVRNIESTNLLKEIGITEWNLELDKYIKKVSKEVQKEERENYESDEDIKRMINDVINELKDKKKKSEI